MAPAFARRPTGFRDIPTAEADMSRVSNILAVKGGSVHRTDPGTSAYEAIEIMVSNGVGSLLVTEDDQIAGIFTERDYLRRVLLQGLDGRTTPVRDVMTARIVCVEKSATVEDCMGTMTQQRFRHLPVVDSGRLVGVISIGDLVKYISVEREVEIRYLTEYITGRA
jgi:CBS domain-containing protein